MVTATAREENGEFCITLGPVTRTVGIYKASWLKALVLSEPDTGHPSNLLA